MQGGCSPAALAAAWWGLLQQAGAVCSPLEGQSLSPVWHCRRQFEAPGTATGTAAVYAEHPRPLPPCKACQIARDRILLMMEVTSVQRTLGLQQESLACA